MRIKLPDLGAAGRGIAGVSSKAAGKATDFGEAVRDRIGDIEGPRILTARRLVKDTNERLNHEVSLLQTERDQASAALARLGEVEVEAWDGPVREFATLLRRLEEAAASHDATIGDPGFAKAFDFDVESVDLSSIDALRGLVLGAGTAAGTGAAAGFTAFAAVGTFATAGTGTAIGALSGAAATNATLAWLGGGTLAAGGGGMAAGVAVLGGIVGLPVLAIGGLVIHRKGKEALAEAEEDAAEAEVVIGQLQAARAMARGIRLRATKMTSAVEELAALLERRNTALRELIDRTDDYENYDEQDRQTVTLAGLVATTLRTVIDVPLIDDQGTLTIASRHAVEAAEQLLAEAAQTAAYS